MIAVDAVADLVSGETFVIGVVEVDADVTTFMLLLSSLLSVIVFSKLLRSTEKIKTQFTGLLKQAASI